jgi:hypothetical protein
MATIAYAVMVPSGTSHTVSHLYIHRSDAVGCVQAYQRARGVSAFVAKIDPALAIARTNDTWVNLDVRSRILHACPSESEARSLAGGEFITHPISATMPLNQGIPQFG